MSKRPTSTKRMEALVERMIPGAEPGTANVYPARGWYRTRYADCMGFTGDVIVDGVRRYIGSWDTLTRCLRNGCVVHDYRGDTRAYATFAFEAKDGTVPSKAEADRAKGLNC